MKVITEKPNIETRIIGTRHGEKEYEALLGSEERARSEDEGDYFKVSLDTRSLDYQIFFERGFTSLIDEPYTSHNTRRLSVEEVVQLIQNLPEYKDFVAKKGLV